MPPVSLALAASREPRLNSSSCGCPGWAACRLGDLGDLIRSGILSGDAPTQLEGHALSAPVSESQKKARRCMTTGGPVLESDQVNATLETMLVMIAFSTCWS